MGVNWAFIGLISDKLEVSLDHNLRNLSVGVSFDRWLLSKQLTISFITLNLCFTWYKKDFNYGEF